MENDSAALHRLIINFPVLLLVSSSVQCSGAMVGPRTAAVDFIDTSFSNKEPLKFSAIRGQPGFSFELWELFQARAPLVCALPCKESSNGGEPRGWACLSTPPKGNKLSKKWVVRQERGEKVGTWEAEECMRKPQMCFRAHFPWTRDGEKSF